MVSPISLLEASKPGWVKLKSRSNNKLHVTATVSVYADHEASYELVISSVLRQRITVKEEPVGSSLPIFCPELHINDDSTFCLGLRVGAKISNRDVAIDWWGKLETFLKCQCLAVVEMDWPVGKGLSHGDSPSVVHIAAIKLASSLNLQKIYAMGVDRNKGAFGEDFPRFRSNGRVWDRRNLFRQSAFAKSFRKQGQRFGRKKRKEEIIRLIGLELLRRQELNNFWSHFLKRQYTCCGRASRCPFSDGELPYVVPEQSACLNGARAKLFKRLEKKNC